jgi:hypothetical protein
MKLQKTSYLMINCLAEIDNNYIFLLIKFKDDE